MPAVNKKFTIVRLLCAFGIAIALSVAVIFAVSEEPVTAIYNLFLGPLQSKRHFFEVFASSVPLIFTGLALGLVFKSVNFLEEFFFEFLSKLFGFFDWQNGNVHFA